jgi:hypothetical protein
MMLRAFALSLLLPAASLFAEPPPEPLSIRSLAPGSSAIVVGGDRLADAGKRFRETPLWQLWSHPSVQEAVRPALAQLREMAAEASKDLGRPETTLEFPASFGLAIASELDEELGLQRPVLIGFVDWSGTKEMVDLLEAMLERAEKDGNLDRGELRGRPVWTSRIADEDADDDDDDFDDFGSPFGGGIGGAIGEFEAFHIVRDGSRHLFASDLAVLGDLLIAVEGRPAGRTVGENRDFLDTMELLGGPDAYAVLLTANLQKLLAAGESGMFLAIAAPILSQVFGDIRGHGFGVAVGRDGAMAEQSIATTVPGPKVGLMKLLTMESTAAMPPAFVPSDASGYSRMNLRFAEIMPTIREIVRGLGEMERQEIEGMLMQMGPTLDGAFKSMGPAVHVYSSIRRPIDVDSFETVAAIPVGEVAAVEPLVALAAPGMGMRRRDFAGHAIYSDEFSPVAIGLGRGHLFLGPASGVEQALRGGDAGEERPREMRAALDSFGERRMVGFGWTDLSALLEQQRAVLSEMPLAGMVGVGGVGGIDAGKVDWEKLLDPELWKQFVGPLTWDLTAVEKGFLTRSRIMPPPK